MTTYVKATDFAIKDSLLTGNPAKLVKGSEIDAEFVAIETADGTNLKVNDIQTITNKTINLNANTLTGTTALFNAALSDGDFATLAGSETLTTKTINLANNTLTGTTAQFNTALSDGDFATLAGSETLTTKTINLTSNTLSGTKAQFNTACSDADFLFSDTGVTDKIQPITASVAANALTITLNATVLDFRSSTLGSGTVNTRTVASPISVVVSSGSTLGTVSAQQSRLAVLAIDNAGTVELAVVNLAGGTNLTETNLISTTAEGGAGAADSASTVYSTTARTNVSYRVVGYIESTQATAGTWATAPSTIQGYGGQAFAAMSSIGYGQTMQDVSGSRSTGVTYYNTTGRPIVIMPSVTNAGSAFNMLYTINGAQQYGPYSPTPGAVIGCPFIVPPGFSYLISSANSVTSWWELR